MKFFNNWIVKNLLLAIAIILVLVMGVAVALRVITRHGQTVSAPDFTNLPLEEAYELAHRRDVGLKVTDSVFVAKLGAGVVFRQNPKPGATVKRGRSIFVTINSIVPRKVVMPNLVGYSYGESMAVLHNRGLTVGRLRYVRDIATNYVLAQRLHGKDVAPGSLVVSGSPIDLTLGLGSEDSRTLVPDVIGQNYITAVENIHSKCLNVGKAVFDKNIRSYPDSVKSVVYKQESAAGVSKTLGQEITIYLTLDGSKVPAK